MVNPNSGQLCPAIVCTYNLFKTKNENIFITKYFLQKCLL